LLDHGLNELCRLGLLRCEFIGLGKSFTPDVIASVPACPHPLPAPAIQPVRHKEKPMTDAQDLAQRYIASWNESDPVVRRQLVGRLWTDNARYADPMMKADGQDGIAELIGGVHSQFPGYCFALTGQADGHGPFVRFSWSLAPASGQAVAFGTDFASVAADGRLEQVTGFLDKLPGTA
jgi:hypothetical protein